MKLIETKTLITATGSISFTSIPQTYTDLVILLSVRGATNENTAISFNGITSGFSGSRFIGNGSSVFAQGVSDNLVFQSFGSDTANTFGNASIYVLNYTGATNKSLSSNSVSENNSNQAFQGLFSTLWSNTSAITSVTLTCVGGSNYVAGSTISLYGILKGSSGGVVVS